MNMDDDHWQYFNYDNVLSEAQQRLRQARDLGQNDGDKDTLQYWTAWVAHANAAACLLPAPPPQS